MGAYRVDRRVDASGWAVERGLWAEARGGTRPTILPCCSSSAFTTVLEAFRRLKKHLAPLKAFTAVQSLQNVQERFQNISQGSKKAHAANFGEVRKGWRWSDLPRIEKTTKLSARELSAIESSRSYVMRLRKKRIQRVFNGDHASLPSLPTRHRQHTAASSTRRSSRRECCATGATNAQKM